MAALSRPGPIFVRPFMPRQGVPLVVVGKQLFLRVATPRPRLVALRAAFSGVSRAALAPADLTGAFPFCLVAIALTGLAFLGRSANDGMYVTQHALACIAGTGSQPALPVLFGMALRLFSAFQVAQAGCRLGAFLGE